MTEAQAHELVDDELGTEPATALRAHLEQCAPCRARVRAVQRFVAALRRQRRLIPRAPTSLQARVRLLLAAAHGHPRPVPE